MVRGLRVLKCVGYVMAVCLYLYVYIYIYIIIYIYIYISLNPKPETLNPIGSIKLLQVYVCVCVRGLLQKNGEDLECSG